MKLKIFALIMTLVVVFSVYSLSISSFAEEPNTNTDERINERYQVIFNHTSGINIIGLSAECNASMGAQYSTSLSITMELQKLSSGSYSTIKTWTKSKTGTSIELEESKVVNILNSYRLKTTFTAGNETVVVFSYP
ncbi:MAG: hypothetical protein IJK26_05555 [Clostridia bacterium]|nr:hypothetical protein [Clostridia bacterium]